MSALKNIRVWRRLGVVLSVLWFIGFFAWMWNDGVHGIEGAMDFQIKHCTDMSEYELDRDINKVLDRFGDFYRGPEWDAAINNSVAKRMACTDKITEDKIN